MKRELYRTIALISMASMAAAPLSAQADSAVVTEEQGLAESQNVEVRENVAAPAANEETADDMTLKEFLLGRFAVHFDEENIRTTAAVGIPVAILAGTAVWKFWPKAATPSVSAKGTSTVLPQTPPRTPNQASQSSSAGSTPSSKSPVRRNSMRGAKSASPYGKDKL